MPGLHIIAGSHRGRRLDSPPSRAIRPTAGHIREALFNRLEHNAWGVEGGPTLEGARVLDAFCGSGALGLEALSRGAAEGCFLDSDPAALEITRQNIERLGERDRTALIRADATTPPTPRHPVTLAFLDPPYRSGLASPALAALTERGWFAPGAVVSVELPRTEDLTLPPGFSALDERRYGLTKLVLLTLSG